MARPHDTGPAPVISQECPFCEGAEAMTPPETFAVRPHGGHANGPGWAVRAFANKFPFFAPSDGVHEVVVNTSRHVTTIGELSDGEARGAATAWAARVAAISADPRGLWPFVFLNQGALAGASLAHTHAQVVGLAFTPPHLFARTRAFEGRPCPICAEIAHAGPRLIDEQRGLVAWCPEAPPLSGGIRIAPLTHTRQWASGPAAADLGPFLAAVGAALTSTVSAALNLWIHEGHGADDYHWHAEIVPRIGTLGGLELGTGVLARTHDPHAMAKTLRAALS